MLGATAGITLDVGAEGDEAHRIYQRLSHTPADHKWITGPLRGVLELAGPLPPKSLSVLVLER